MLLVAQLKSLLARFRGGFVSLHEIVSGLLGHGGVVLLQVYVRLVHPDDALVGKPVGLLHLLHRHLLSVVSLGELMEEEREGRQEGEFARQDVPGKAWDVCW